MKKYPTKPPSCFRRLLSLFFCHHKWEIIHNDLEEKYNSILKEATVFKANMWYVIQLLHIVRGKMYNHIYWSIPMFKNYVKIASRNIKKYKGYSMIRSI